MVEKATKSTFRTARGVISTAILACACLGAVPACSGTGGDAATASTGDSAATAAVAFTDPEPSAPDDAGDPDRFGPLAVIAEGASGGDLALGGRGTLRIDDRCVRLDTGDRGAVLLAWQAGAVAWSPETGAITLRDDAGVTSLHDGDRIAVGGSDATTGVTWLAAPDPSCEGTPFVVHSVTSAD